MGQLLPSLFLSLLPLAWVLSLLRSNRTKVRIAPESGAYLLDMVQLSQKLILFPWLDSKKKVESISCSITSNSWRPMDYSLPGSSVHGILQARILEWVAISYSRGSSRPRDQTWVSCNAGRFFAIWATRDNAAQMRRFHPTPTQRPECPYVC